MKDIFQTHSGTIDNICQLINILSFQTTASKLCCITRLCRKVDTETRWSSTFEMIPHYLELHPLMTSFELPKIDDLLLEDQSDDIQDLCKKLQDLQYINNKLEDPRSKLADALVLFDAVLSKHQSVPTMVDVWGQRLH